MTRRSLITAVCLGAGLLALACAWRGLWLETGAALALGLFWLASGKRSWAWAADAALAALVVLAVRAVYADAQPVIVLAALVAALAAWDLDHFARRLGALANNKDTQPLVRRHLARLAAVGALGLALAMVALSVHVHLGAGVVLLVGLLAILGLAQAVRFLRQAS